MAQLASRPTPTELQTHPLDSHSDDDLDLLHQTLDSSSSRNSHSLAEDHLEDILSLPLAQELHSRRSHAKLSHASSFSSLSNHEPLPRAPPLSSSPARRPQKSRSTSPELSNRPTSPPGPTKIPLSRTRSRSRGPSDHLGAGSGSGRERGGAAEAAAAAEGWETLQVGGSSSSPSPSMVRARPIKGAAPGGGGGASSAGMQRSRTAGSLPSSNLSQPLSFPSSSANKVPPLPLTPPTNSAGVRKRAQTSNLLSSPASSPAGAGGKRALSPSTSSPTTPRTSNSPTPTPRAKPSTTASPPAPSATKKARRKSFSAATSYRLGELDREEPVPAAPWLQEGPRVFRDQGGGEGFKSEGRVEDMVLPAVARRLEAERLARLESEGLITHWDRDGAPMVASLVGRNGGSVSGTGTPKPMDGEEGGKEEQKEDGERSRKSSAQQSQSNAVGLDFHSQQPPTPSFTDNRTSLPPPQPPQKDQQHQPPSSSDRERDPHGLSRPLSSAEVGAGEKGRSKEERRRLEQERDKEQKGCCAACVVM